MRAGVLLATLLAGLVATPAVADPCTPRIAPVDPQATPAAVCLAATLDAWRSMGLMGVGQQLDLARRGSAGDPLLELAPLRPAVVGFDLEELLVAEEYFADDPIPYLIDLARSGLVLTATWHPDNPGSGGRYDDRSWTSLARLFDPGTPEAQAYWAEFDRAMSDIRLLQDAGVALILKPFHEAGGDWFWWGSPEPWLYRQLFTAAQDRAWSQGVHNVLWAYAASPRSRDGIVDPLRLIPPRIDLAGLDVYDDEVTDPVDRLPLTDYRRLANRVPRMALTEVGPYLSTTGEWNPRVITRTLRRNDLYASFALLWRDGPAPTYLQQISSLEGGPAWLAGCPNGLCRLTR